MDYLKLLLVSSQPSSLGRTQWESPPNDRIPSFTALPKRGFPAADFHGRRLPFQDCGFLLSDLLWSAPVHTK